MNGLRAGMAAPPLMATARVAAGVTSLTCQEPTFTGPLPNGRSRPKAVIRGDAVSSPHLGAVGLVGIVRANAIMRFSLASCLTGIAKAKLRFSARCPSRPYAR
jgi:hypothetical protein